MLGEIPHVDHCICVLEACPHCKGRCNDVAMVYVKGTNAIESEPPAKFCAECADWATAGGDAVYTNREGAPLVGIPLRSHLKRRYYRLMHNGRNALVVNAERVGAEFPLAAAAEFFRGQNPGPGLEMRQVLVCSSKHIEEIDAKMLDSIEEDSVAHRALCLKKYAEGWQFTLFMSMQREMISDDVFSSTFWDLLNFAETHGFDRIEIDADGPIIPGLPTFSW